MSKIEVKAEVSKEAYELAKALADVAVSVKAALKDGFQPTDLASILAPNFVAISAAVEGMDKLGDEQKEDVAAFIKAWSLPGADLAGVFLKKAEAPKA
jgi:hypothetical protein